MMDELAVQATDEFSGAGYPRNAAAVLICETDGVEDDAERDITRIAEIVTAHGATTVRRAGDDDERERIWKGRKSAFPAMGRVRPDYYCMDGTVPRKRLGEILREISAMSERYGLPVANVFHAGDGNLHPLILFDSGAGETEQARQFGSEILQLCLRMGGTITGEHGVGLEKINEMCLQFPSAELECFRQIKRAFDPPEILNPGKAVPTLNRCAEFGAMHVHHGEEKFPDLPRF